MTNLDSAINERWKRVVVDRAKKGFYSTDGGVDRMKLSNEEKVYLYELGYSDSDVKQIEEVMQKRYTKYEMERNGKTQTITRETAIKLLGRKEYLTAMARCAFHWSTVRQAVTGEYVYFDSRKYFFGE